MFGQTPHCALGLLFLILAGCGELSPDEAAFDERANPVGDGDASAGATSASDDSDDLEGSEPPNGSTEPTPDDLDEPGRTDRDDSANPALDDDESSSEGDDPNGAETADPSEPEPANSNGGAAELPDGGVYPEPVSSDGNPLPQPSASNGQPDPSTPAEPTAPDPTPDPTAPDPTAPDPTAPDPTAPDPTTQPTTEPSTDPTGPDPTTPPDPTAPDPTTNPEPDPPTNGVTQPIVASALSNKVTEGGLDPLRLPALLEDADEIAHATLMQTFALSLGNVCNTCHTDDFSAWTDGKRVTVHMWEDIVAKLEMADGSPLYCDSCHQGKERFLDRSNADDLEVWMQENMVDKLARRDGQPMDCATCHGEPANYDLIETWSQ